MTLPRIVVDVTALPPNQSPNSTSTPNAAGWSVEVTVAGDGTPLVPSYTMAAVELPHRGPRARVPALPPDRPLPDPAEPFHELCAGAVEALEDLLGGLDDVEGEGEPGDVAAYGRWLFECLLAPAWPAVLELDAVKRAAGVELALRWPAEAADLHRLVWEAMHDGPRPLAGHRDLTVAITRLVPVPADRGQRPPARLDRLPRVLMAAGSALYDDTIRPGAMFMGLTRSLSAVGPGVSRIAQEVSAESLHELCRQFEPDIVHLVAHGDLSDGRGVIHLRGGRPAGGETNAAALAAALTVGGRAPTMLTLAACDSGLPGESAPLAAELVLAGIPIVSAMAGHIGEIACRLYTRKAVRAVQDGVPIAEAAARGRRAALLPRAGADDGRLDWAMPALFVAEHVPVGFAVLDPEPGRRLLRAAGEMDLRQENVFIERSGIFEPVEPLFGRGAAETLKAVVYGNEVSIKDLGGTRLLREIGLRLLRAGHIPLLLFYSSENSRTKPKNAHAVVDNVIRRLMVFARAFDLTVAQATVLGAYGSPGPDGVPSAQDLRDLADGDGQDRLFDALGAFAAASDGQLDLDWVASRLAADLEAFAGRVARRYGAPFGPHSRVVVLADELSTWSDGATALLGLAERGGFGRHGALVATGSYGQESPVKTFRERHSHTVGYTFADLAELSLGEAALGYEWVLLNPWKQHKDTYARHPRGDKEMIAGFFAEAGQRPALAISSTLYSYARLMVLTKLFTCNDDEAAFRNAYPEPAR